MTGVQTCALPIFDAWTFTASSNNLTASFTTPAPRSMQNPLFILRGYNLATEPFQVKVGGATLTADVDYYASAITSRSELWLTLRGQFNGTTSLEVIGAAPVVNFTVTPSAGANGSIAPSAPQTVASGATTTFTVTPSAGYSASVGGSCNGSFNSATNVYTTAMIAADCNVVASFIAAPPTVLFVQSRKTHGAAGDFDVMIDRSQQINQNVTVEPRTIGAGHTIVFRFDQMITITGTATTTNGAVTTASVGQEVQVTLTGIAENSRATISVSGVNGSGTGAVSMGFLVGDVNNTRSVNSSDISGVKARSGQTTTTANFQFDVNASGAINSSDISAVKARSGSALVP